MKAWQMHLWIGIALVASSMSGTASPMNGQISAEGGNPSVDSIQSNLKEISPIVRIGLKQLNHVKEPRDDQEKGNDRVDQPPPPPARVPAKTPMLQLKRWPAQILSATYGTSGKDADVTAKVKEYVEKLQQKFSANPKHLGADPNPGWNKSLRIVYMKDGVRREQRRNENEEILPESFYGPQDAGELRAWLPESRWGGEQTEIQFHADLTFTSPGHLGINRWEATGPKKIRLTWEDNSSKEFVFDYTWSGFSEVENGKNVYHVLK